MSLLKKLSIAISILLLGFVAFSKTAPTKKSGPGYTKDGQLRFPTDYREWIYLTSGFDMSYTPDMKMDHHMFDNVFVNPDSWRAFQSTGKWPDKTLLVLELRGAELKGSINKGGSFQSEPMRIEVHVKDESRFVGKWAFFGFSTTDTTSKMTSLSEDCYSCHADHGAVDTTFVQFYPTLKPIAVRKGTIQPGYQNEASH